jgi:hypothetical protein
MAVDRSSYSSITVRPLILHLGVFSGDIVVEFFPEAGGTDCVRGFLGFIDMKFKRKLWQQIGLRNVFLTLV